MSPEPKSSEAPESEEDAPSSHIILKLVAIIVVVGFIANSETCSGTSQEMRLQNNRNAVNAIRSEVLEDCVDRKESSSSCRDSADWAAELMGKKLEKMEK